AGTAPTSEASTQSTRKAVTVPEGYVVTHVTGRSVLCPKGELRWTQESLLRLEPATRPSTMPSEVVVRLRGRRDELVKQMTADLALRDAHVAAAFVDDKLAPLVRQFRDLRVPLYFFETSIDKLKELVAGGWGSDWFSYNAASGELLLHTNIALDPDKPADDVVLPVLISPEMTLDQKREALGRAVRDSEFNVQNQLAARAQGSIQVAIADFINDQAI